MASCMKDIQRVMSLGCPKNKEKENSGIEEESKKYRNWQEITFSIKTT